MAEQDEDTGVRSGTSSRSAAEMRKINKPLMEKKRRERINNCLNQLKMFLMDATKKDSSYYSKLEKADILEMSVKYLKNLQRQHLAVAMATDPKVISKYATGYSQCATEVTRYLAKLDGLDSDVKTRLSSHLNSCVQKLNTAATTQSQSTPMASFPVTGSTTPQQVAVSLAPPSGIMTQKQLDLALSQFGGNEEVTMLNLNDQLQNQISQAKQSIIANQPSSGSVAGVPLLPVQLIPAKLPSGDVVLLLTNNQAHVQTPNFSSSLTFNQGVPIMTSSTMPSASTVTTEAAVKMTSPQPNIVTSLQQESVPVALATNKTLNNVEVPVPDSSTSPKDKAAPNNIMTSSIKLNVTSQSDCYSNLIPPYPVPSFPGFQGKVPMFNQIEKPKPLKIETTNYPLPLSRAGPSHRYPNPPSPSEALDLSDPNKDLNNNYRNVPDRNVDRNVPDRNVPDRNVPDRNVPYREVLNMNAQNRNEAVVFYPYVSHENDPMWRPW